MSEMIDQRTVEMRFDNSNFEKNVESSLGTIDKLKKSLNFQDSVKGLDAFEKSLDKFSLDKLKESANGVKESFSDMLKTIGNVYLIRKGVEAFNGLENAAKNMIKTMSGINNMKAGWDKYESKINSVQTIMNATGRTIDVVSNALDKLNWYSDETSASFSDMVDNIGKFTSAGVELEDAVAAMQGVFNWASTSGGNKTQAARAMYNLSQAISVGSMKLMDWKSIENANMSTVEFKQTVLDTGVALGKLIKTGDKYYTKIGKKQEVSTKNFNATLNTGWFDSELLVSVLKRYSEFSDKVYAYMEEHPEIDTATEAMDEMREKALEAGEAFDELGYKWFRSAQEARTFTDVVDSIKDAVSTQWMKTFELIFGNYEEAKKMWSDLAEDLYTVFADPLNKQNDFLYELMTSAYTKLKKEILSAGLSVEEFESEVEKSIETNEEAKSQLDELIKTYGSLGAAIEAGQVPSDWILGAFKNLGQAEKDAERTTHTLEEVQQIVKDTWTTNKYGTGNERIEAYKALGYDPVALQKLVNLYAKKGKIELEDLTAVGIEAGKSYSEVWKDFVNGNEDLINSLDEVSGRTLLVGGISKMVSSGLNSIVAFREGIEEVFKINPENVKKVFSSFYKFADSLQLSEEGAEKLKNFSVSLFQPLKSIGVVAKKFIGGLFGGSFEGLWPKIQEGTTKAFDGIYTFQRRVAKVFKSLEDSAYVNKAVTKFSEYFGKFKTDIPNLGAQFEEYFKETDIGKAFYKNVDKWKSIWNEMNTGGQNAFDTLIKTGKEFWKQWKEEHGKDINPLQFFISSFEDGIKKFKESKLFESIRKPFDSIRDKINNLFGKKQPEGVKSGLKGEKSFFGNLYQGVVDGIQFLKTSLSEGWFGKQLGSVKNAYKTAINAFERTFNEDGKNTFDAVKSGLGTFWKMLTRGTAKNRVSKTDEMAERAAIHRGILGKGILGGLGDIGSEDGELLEQLRSKLSTFWNWAKPLLQTMAESFAKSFNLQNLAQFINSLAALNFSKIGSGFKNFMKSLSKQTGGFFDQYSGILANIKNYKLTDQLKETMNGLVDAFSPLKDTKRELRARSILEFAAALGIIAGALYLISGISVPDLKKAGIVIGVIVGVLAGIGVLLSKLGNVEFKVALSGTGQMLKLIALILAISIALKNVGKAAQGIASAVDILTGAIEKFSELAVNKIKFQEALMAVQDLIFALGASAGLAGLGLGNLFGGTALTILAFAGAIRILYDAIEKITNLSIASPKNLEQSIKSIGELIIKLGQASALAGLTNGSWKDAGAAETILALTGAIEILQNAVFSFAKIPAKQLEKSVNAISELLNSLGKASFWSGFLSSGLGGFGRAASILAFGKSIRSIVSSIESIMTLSIHKERFELATETVKTILYTITGMTGALGLFNRLGLKVSFPQATAIAAFGGAIVLIANSIEKLGKINRERLVAGGNAVAQIGVMLAAFTGILGLVNKFANLSIKELGSAAVIIAFGTAISSIGNTVIKLGDLDKNKMDKGLNATWSIAGIVAALTIVSSRFNNNIKFSGLNFVSIATGMFIFGQAIEKLGTIDDGTLKKGLAVVSILSIVMSACIALMNLGVKTPSWTNALNIAALTGAVWVLGESAKTFANMDDDQLKRAAEGILGLLGALTLISRYGLGTGNIGTLFNSLSLLIISGIVALLTEVAKSFSEYEWGQLGKIGAAAGGMITMIWAISKIIATGSKISIGAIAKFGVIIAEVGGILAVLGFLYQNISGLSDAMTAGGDFLGKIGEAIGKFFGSIIGGFKAGIAQSMPAVGSAMAKFAENSEPFFEILDKFKDIDPMASLTQLSEALNQSIWSEIWAKLFKIFPEGDEPTLKSLEAFGNGLSAFAPGFSTFLSSFEEKDTDKLKTVSESLQTINEIGSNPLWIDNDSFTTNNPLLNFGKAISSAATEIEKAITAFNKLTTVNDNATKAIESLTKIGQIETGENFNLDINTPFFTAVLSWKEQSMTEFATDLATAVGNIRTFVDRANDFQFQSYGGKLKTTVLAEMLTQMANVGVPATGGIYTFWKDYSGAITSFCKDIVTAMPDIKSFISQVNNDTESPDMDKIKDIIGIITDMASIVMPVNEGTTFMTFEQLIGHYHAALSQISILANEISTTYAKDLETVHSLVDVFKPFTIKKEDINLGALEGIPEKIKKFVSELNTSLGGTTIDENFSNSLQGLADLLSSDMKEIGFTDAASDITGGLDNLASINQDNGANTLAPAMETINTFVGAVKKLMRIQNDFHETKFGNNIERMIEIVNTNFGNVTSKARTNMNNIRNFFESVQDLYGDKYHFEMGAENKFGTLISALVAAIDMFSPNTSIEDLKAYTDWMEDLATKQDMFESAGKAISSFAIDTNKLNSVTSFIDALKGEFNITPGRYEFVDDGWGTGGHFEEMPGYFSKIAEDIIKALGILKGTDKNPVDFTEFDTLTTKLNSLASAMARFTGSNDISEKMRGLVKGINDSILGDGTEENPGIKDFGDRLSQFDSLYPVFTQLESYQTDGLKDIVPNILSGISTAIDNFTYDPNGIATLREAMTEIHSALEILNGDDSSVTVGIKNGLGNNVNRSGRKRVSKSGDQLAEKIAAYQSSNRQIFQLADFADAINNTNIDPNKADMLVNIATSLAEAAEGIAKENPASMVGFVRVLANSIKDNSDITKQASDILIQDMLAVLEIYIDKFIEMGVMFVKSIAGGMESAPDAVNMAATMATRILTQFSLASETFGGQKGKEMLNSVLSGLTSQESKDAINSAFESLFGGDDEFQSSGSNQNPFGMQVGSQFAKDFMEGFATNLNIDEDGSFGGIFQTISDFVNQLGTMNGTEAGMEFGTFMTDFAQSASKAIQGDAGTEIQTTCESISSVISGAVPDGNGLGYNFVEGIRDGLIRGIADFGKEISSLAAQLGALMNEGTAGAIDAHSPSRTAMELGENYVEGLEIGVDRNLNKAYGAGQSVGNSTIKGTKKAFLSSSEATMLINMLKNANGPVSFKGYIWNKSDIGYLQKYITSIQNATKATNNFSKNTEAASNSGGGSSGGGGGESDDSSDKTNGNVIKTDVKGIELTIGEIGTIIKGLIQNGNGSFEYNGNTYHWTDLPKEFVSSYKDYFDNVFGNYDGFKDGLDTLLGLTQTNVKGTLNTEEGIDRLSNVWEFDKIKVGFTNDALNSLNDNQSSLFKSGIQKIINGTANSTKPDRRASNDKLDAKASNSNSNVFNFNQTNISPKPLSKAEIYRQTRNQFAMLKGVSQVVS